MPFRLSYVVAYAASRPGISTNPATFFAPEQDYFLVLVSALLAASDPPNFAAATSIPRSTACRISSDVEDGAGYLATKRSASARADLLRRRQTLEDENSAIILMSTIRTLLSTTAITTHTVQINAIRYKASRARLQADLTPHAIPTNSRASALPPSSHRRQRRVRQMTNWGSNSNQDCSAFIHSARSPFLRQGLQHRYSRPQMSTGSSRTATAASVSRSTSPPCETPKPERQFFCSSIAVPRREHIAMATDNIADNRSAPSDQMTFSVLRVRKAITMLPRPRGEIQ